LAALANFHSINCLIRSIIYLFILFIYEFSTDIHACKRYVYNKQLQVRTEMLQGALTTALIVTVLLLLLLLLVSYLSFLFNLTDKISRRNSHVLNRCFVIPVAVAIQPNIYRALGCRCSVWHHID